MLTADQALERLMSGNERYVSSKPTHPHQTPEYRADLTRGQHPFAVILGCSDSRVSPEVIFDQGLGDIFVVRVAGNIVNDIVLASIEYAVAHLHTPLVMVLGHSECGAVGATVVGGDLEGHLPSLAEAIQPAVDKVEDAFGDVRNNAAKENARMVREQLKRSGPVLSELVAANKLKAIAAYYDLHTGMAEIL